MSPNTINVSENLSLIIEQTDTNIKTLADNIDETYISVYRIIEGVTKKPKKDILKKIAEHYQISLEQLIGLKPIPWLESFTKERRVPIYGWTQPVSRCDWVAEELDGIYRSTTITDKAGPNTFALEIKDHSMELAFKKDTIVSVDPDKEVTDRCFAVVSLHNSPSWIVREVIIDGTDHFLGSTNVRSQDLEMRLMGENDKYIGIVIEAKKVF
ncbi:MAG: hypothetical protein GY750_04895 [Lentisphaerae bacterium]|nr:hypothetical protein [Lentisphaerota bacterium]